MIIQSKESIIKSLIERPEKEWSAAQKDLMTNYEHFILYTQILRSLTIILPLNIELINQKSESFSDNKKLQKELNSQVKKIIGRKGTDLEKYTKSEKEISALSYQLQILEKGGQHNVLFRIIPEKSQWVSPWAAQQSTKILKKWQNLAISYRNQDKKTWQKFLTELSDTYSKTKLKTELSDTYSKTKLKTEVIYNTLNLLTVSGILYALSFFLLVLANLLNNKNIIKFSYAALLTGFTAHSINILLRVYILDRPPVGTLYESILFVSLICVAASAFIEGKQKNNIGILLGSVSGVLLLTAATAFVSEDTMNTLVAVLNTNFWLGTHVLCITIGYGWCLIASLLAHVYLVQTYLVQKLIRPENVTLLTHLQRNLKTLVILSLLFTTIGTILGGIWADQSWGRFWGWDPKENGALLIVLWLIWLLHGRISKHLSEIGFVIASAFLSVIVVLAWFGVNLLNVGLHSYGFISGIAWGIGLFCTLETLIIGGLWFGLRHRGALQR